MAEVPETPPDSWTRYSSALQRILDRPALRSQVEQDVEGALAEELRVTPEMLVDLKRVLVRLPPAADREESEPRPRSDERRDTAIEDKAVSAEEFFVTTFGHLRRAALIATVMSVTIFVMGLFLLGIAAWQSITGRGESSAIALAASGIVAIVAAFYRSPVQQTRLAAAQMQRSTMILMTYMLGLSLVSKSLFGRPTADAAEQLNTLTAKLVGMLDASGSGDTS